LEQVGRQRDALNAAFTLMGIFQLSPAAFASLERIPVREALHEFWQRQALSGLRARSSGGAHASTFLP